MTIAIVSVHLIHLMNADSTLMFNTSQTDLDCKSASWLLSSTSPKYQCHLLLLHNPKADTHCVPYVIVVLNDILFSRKTCY